MPFISLSVFQDGTLFIHSPWAATSEIPSYCTKALKSLPTLPALVTTDKIVRWKCPIGFPLLPAVLTAFENQGWKLISSSGCAPKDNGDLTFIALMQHSK